jgi:glycosyltransferase involved in cell wall biosynthesis
MTNVISVTILTKNSARTIQSTLESLKDFAEIVIADTGSTDTTLDICKDYSNVTVKKIPFDGFGPSHNTASSLASNDWILSIDSDEVVSCELIKELTSMPLKENTVYSIRRHNYYNQKKITTCSGWNPDWVIRLYNRKITSFSSDKVHERILAENLTISPLKGTITHTPYLCIQDFLDKMQSYSSLFALQSRGKKKAGIFTALAHSLAAFFKSYILKKGFIQGQEGLIISLYNSHVSFYKYLKLAESCKK